MDRWTGFFSGLNPEAQEFRPAGMGRSGSSVGGDSDLTITQERWNAAEASRKAHEQTGTSSRSSPSPETVPAPLTFTLVNFARRPQGNNNNKNTTIMADPRRNDVTPRNKRMSNGPGASSADKYPEDSPTRLRHPPRFPAAMNNPGRRVQRQLAEQQADLHVEDTKAWPSLGEASKQYRNERQRAVRTAPTPHATRSSSASTSASDNAMAPGTVSGGPEAGPFSPEQRDDIEAQVEAFRQRLIQQHTPIRNRTDREQPSSDRIVNIQELNPVQPQSAPHLLYQRRHAQKDMSQQSTQQNTGQLNHEMQHETAHTRAPFVQDSLAGLITSRQQGLAMQQQQQALLSQAFGAGANSAYNFDRLAASQQAEREATVAQLHSAFFEPQQTYAQPGFMAHTGSQAYTAHTSGSHADHPSSRGYDTRNPASAVIPGLYHPMAQSVDHSEQDRFAQQHAFTNPHASEGYINAAYIPIFDSSMEGRSTNTGAPSVDAVPAEPTFTPADYDISPPPSHLVSSTLDLVDENVHDNLSPDRRPLTPSQETGARYGIEIGGLGVSALGTSDRTGWLPGPWNAPGQGHQGQDHFRVRPREHPGWGGWEWAMEKGWGDDSKK